jgi:hypothetical protein
MDIYFASTIFLLDFGTAPLFIFIVLVHFIVQLYLL